MPVRSDQRPARVIHPAEAPSATTVRFALLVAAVLAAGTAIFIAIHGYLPSRGESLTDRGNRCAGVLESDPAWTAAPTPEIRDQILAAAARYRACLRPALGEIAVTVAVGHGLLFGLAGVSYLTHPWWIVRRRRLRRLSAATSPKMVGDLDQMSREMGLARSPDWRIAPYHRTSGGQAFGTVRRRQVQLDAGLVVRSVLDRPAFRAVVLHELAHLRNRDVDKTYLTIGVWRAFLLVAVLPLAALMVHPRLFRAPFDFHWSGSSIVVDGLAGAAYRVGALVALAVLVYLTRNAVLRVRESHADAVAAAMDGSASALPAVLERLPPPRRWWARWGTHPHPGRRLDTVRDPRLLLSADPWELAGVGIAAGVFAVNLTLMLGAVAGFDPALGVAMVGLVAGTAMAAVLAISIWRTTTAAPGDRPSIRTWLALPLALTGGFLVGRFLDLDPRPTLMTEPSVAWWRQWIISALLLSTGAVLVAAWVASAARGILGASHPRRWAMPAVVFATALVGATGFLAWLPASLGEFGLRWSDPPGPGAEIGWYAWLVAATGWQLQPAAYLVHLPLTLPALGLLWLVPVVAGLRRPASRVPLRRAIIPGLIGGVCAVAIGVALPFLAKATLPASVRQLPGPDTVDETFPFVIASVTNFTGMLAVVIVMVVVVARGGRHRPVLAVFAAMLTALVFAIGAVHIILPMQCFANVFDLVPGPTHCLEPIDLPYLAELVNTLLVQGIVVAVPVALITAAVVQRQRPGVDGVVVPLTSRGYLATVAFIVLLTVVIAALTWGILPDFGITWLEPTFG